ISGASLAPWHKLMSLLPRSWRPARRKRYKGGNPAGVESGESKTRLSRSLPQALADISQDVAKRIGVYGDASFFEAARTAASTLECRWLSNDFLNDQPRGAVALNPANIGGLDAILVGGRDVSTNYRLALRQMLAAAAETPVHWVAENWEFCGGTLAVPK